MATEEAGEPLDCIGVLIGKTVWYSLEVTEPSTVTVTTLGSDYDTILAVYVGTDPATLTQLHCNDDSDTPGDLASVLEF